MSPLDIFSDESLTLIILKFKNLFTSSKKKSNKGFKNESHCCNTSTNPSLCTLNNSSNLQINTECSTNSSSSSCSSSPLSSCSQQQKKKRNKPNLTIKTTNNSKKCIMPTLSIPKQDHLTEHLSGDVIKDVFLDWIYTTAYSKFY